MARRASRLVRTHLTHPPAACEAASVDLADLWRLDGTAQAELVRRGEVTCAELVDAAIARVEGLNPALNAVVTPLYERARAAAVGGPAGPFAGVPMLVKDACLEIAGTPYYLGTSVLRDIGWRSLRTTETARRLERGGLVVIGKANAPALSAGITTAPGARPRFGADSTSPLRRSRHSTSTVSTTSASRINCSSTFTSAESRRSSRAERLPMPVSRSTKPESGKCAALILSTSAPCSARLLAQVGPASTRVRSRARTLLKGLG